MEKNNDFRHVQSNKISFFRPKNFFIDLTADSSTSKTKGVVVVNIDKIKR